MKMRWFGKSFIAQVATILSIGLLTSIGLCGANAVAWIITNTPLEDGNYFLQRAGAIEIDAIAFFAIALALVGINALILTLIQRFTVSKGHK